MGKIGVLVQNYQIRLKNGQKWTEMVKNGELRLKMAISVAGVPSRSETVPYPQRGIIRQRGGIFKGLTRGFDTFMTILRPFFGQFSPFLVSRSLAIFDQKPDFPIVIS